MIKKPLMAPGTGSGTVTTSGAADVQLIGYFFEGKQLRQTFSHSQLLNGGATFAVVNMTSYSFVVSAIFSAKSSVELRCDVNGRHESLTLKGGFAKGGLDAKYGEFQIFA